MISREEVVNWKYHPVTMEFLEAIKQRIAGLTEEIIVNARQGDPRDQAYRAGAIQAFQDVLDADF